MVVKVYGKLNDQEIILEQIDEERWNVIVPRVKEGRYYIDLFALDDAGNSSFLATALFVVDANCTCVEFHIIEYDLILQEDHIKTEFMSCKCNEEGEGRLIEKKKPLEYYQGEVRKIVMLSSCECKDDFVINDDFIISTAEAELIKGTEEPINLPLEIDINGKKLAAIIDTSKLKGYYKLFFTFSINEEVLKRKLDVKVI